MQSTTPLLDFAERNRNEVYAEFKHTHPVSRQVVLDALRTLKDATAEEIALFLQKPINKVCGRITELHSEKYGIMAIVAIGKRRNLADTANATVWTLKEATECQTPE